MFFGTTTPAPICDIDDLNELLLVVLPAFVALAKDIIDSNDNAIIDLTTALDKEDLNFYNEFYCDGFTLNLCLPVTNLTSSNPQQTSDEEEVRQKLMLILDELESRFLSRRLLGQYTEFRWGDSTTETYPKLRALCRRLQENGATDQVAVSCLRGVVKIASSNHKKRLNLLARLRKAIDLFAGLRSAGDDDDGPPCPVRFEAYPSKHVQRHSSTLYNLLRRGWSCSSSSGCYIRSHVARNMQLSLTAFRRFEMAPTYGQPSLASQAFFRVLFPTEQKTSEWQDSQINVKDQGHEDAERQELMEDLCIAIRHVPKGCRLKMLVYSGKLWQLRVDIDQSFFEQTENCKFESLRNLLQPNGSGHKSRFSTIEGKERLILSFVLATAVLQFHRGSWLQRTLSSENVCFMTSTDRLTFDITKPYLTTSCSDACKSSDTKSLNNAHRYPVILSLGILLLEIASGSPIVFKENEDQCFSALEHRNALISSWKKNSSKAIPDGLVRALAACLEPGRLSKKRLDKARTTENQINRYIFEEIVYPLGEALSIAYELKLDRLHDEILQVGPKNLKPVREPRDFNHYEARNENPKIPMRHLSRGSYKVGWICPLEVEQFAAMAMLDEEHQPLPQPAGDTNVYNLGSINSHNVVIAGLPRAGNCSAATAVTQMRMTFPNLKYILLVGIGGGVPVKTDYGMIRLGHVVVSTPTDSHSGAIQYDHGKAMTSHFERKGSLASPPAALLNAVREVAVQRQRMDYDPIWKNTERIQTCRRRRTLHQFKFPGVANDHLYPSDYEHQIKGAPCKEGGCDPTKRIERQIDEDENDCFVVVHRGTIASGELVLKDAKKRDMLAEEHGVLCFEMEAAGALADFPCMVIRGISDYCDSHKNDVWHGYAAAVAAAYARQLFFHMAIEES